MKRLRKGYLLCFVLFILVTVVTIVRAQDASLPAGDITTALKDFSKLSDDNKNMILTATGMPSANEFDLGKMIAITIFSSIGFVGFVYGKKNALWRPMVLGISLMVYPYFWSGTLMVYLLGIALTVALYYWRE